MKIEMLFGMVHWFVSFFYVDDLCENVYLISYYVLFSLFYIFYSSNHNVHFLFYFQMHSLIQYILHSSQPEWNY